MNFSKGIIYIVNNELFSFVLSLKYTHNKRTYWNLGKNSYLQCWNSTVSPNKLPSICPNNSVSRHFMLHSGIKNIVYVHYKRKGKEKQYRKKWKCQSVIIILCCSYAKVKNLKKNEVKLYIIHFKIQYKKVI